MSRSRDESKSLNNIPESESQELRNEDKTVSSESQNRKKVTRMKTPIIPVSVQFKSLKATLN